MSGLNFTWGLLALNPLNLLALTLFIQASFFPNFQRLFSIANLLVTIVDRINEAIIELVKWFALIMVLLTAALVVGRYVFGVGSLKGQEAIIYMHGILFLFASGATLIHNGHVRVDVLFSRLSAKQKMIVDILGSIFFLIPLCLTILIVSQSYVAMSWRVLEGSPESDGLQWVYWLKTAIPIFAILMLMQASAQILRGTLMLLDRPMPEAKPASRLV